MMEMSAFFDRRMRLEIPYFVRTLHDYPILAGKAEKK